MDNPLSIDPPIEARRHELLAALARMPRFLQDLFAALDAEAARAPGAAGLFSPVEQVWHLADLERAGFGQRIHRLQAEHEPQLPDFDGAAVARERVYRSLSLPDGLRAFELARRANLAAFAALPTAAWSRSGTQEGVGRVALGDLPLSMHRHDEAHRAEITDWLRHTGRA